MTHIAYTAWNPTPDICFAPSCKVTISLLDIIIGLGQAIVLLRIHARRHSLQTLLLTFLSEHGSARILAIRVLRSHEFQIHCQDLQGDTSSVECLLYYCIQYMYLVKHHLILVEQPKNLSRIHWLIPPVSSPW
jgi:hypothetical protein